jgi:hypothetical protein
MAFGALHHLKLVMRNGSLLGTSTGRYLSKPMFYFEQAKDLLCFGIVPAIGYYTSIEPNPVYQQMNVRMPGIVMPKEYILMLGEATFIKKLFRDRCDLLIGEIFVRREV